MVITSSAGSAIESIVGTSAQCMVKDALNVINLIISPMSVNSSLEVKFNTKASDTNFFVDCVNLIIDPML